MSRRNFYYQSLFMFFSLLKSMHVYFVHIGMLYIIYYLLYYILSKKYVRFFPFNIRSTKLFLIFLIFKLIFCSCLQYNYGIFLIFQNIFFSRKKFIIILSLTQITQCLQFYWQDIILNQTIELKENFWMHR